MDFYPDTPAKLYHLQQDYQELPTVATNFEALSKTLQEMNFKDLINNINDLAKQVNQVVASGEVQHALTNFNHAAVAIESTANNINTEIKPLSNNLTHTLAQLDRLITQLNVQTPELATSLQQNLTELHQSLASINSAATTIGNTFSEDAPLFYRLNATLEDVSRGAQAFRNLSDTLEQQPESLIRGKKLPVNGE